MAWIPTIGKDAADGELSRLYDQIAPGDEPLDNILGIHSLHPRTLRDHLMLYRTLMHGDGPLPRRERELIAVAVSSANRCHY
jgi:alkylhydroperoxidase family enzyme